MMSSDAKQLWERVVQEIIGRDRSSSAHDEFLQPGVERVPILRDALLAGNGNQRAAALHLLDHMPVEERQQLFPELLELARSAHGPVGAVRDLIASLPRDWVLTHIDPLVETILRGEEYDDYWMMVELYEQLDRERALQLARRARAHTDADIRELGELALERLSSSVRA
jgi:hypothetical protein